jgi:hypothetical protein
LSARLSVIVATSPARSTARPASGGTSTSLVE